MDLRNKTYNALFWSFVDRGGEQVIRFAFSIVLARLLLPEHFGLIGMAYVVTELARVFVQSGFGLALINNSSATKTDECSVFYFNVFIGAVGTLLIFMFSPAIGRFYKSPFLAQILRVLSFNVVLGAFGTIQTVLMTKRIDFKAQTKVSLPATLLSGSAGIVLAYLNFGVWALVVQTFLRTFFHTVFLWFVHSWRPQLIFSLHSLRSMFSFGSKLLFGALAQMLFGNIYTILIGKLFSPTQLGFYTRANQTQQLPLDTIWAVIGRVTFPLFSAIKGEPEKLKRALAKATGNVSFLIFPSLTISAIIAPELFRFLFGDKWTPSVPMFQILCFANILYPMEHLRNNAILAKGNATLHFNLQLFKYAATLVAIVFSFPFGLHGMLVAFGAMSYISFFVSSFFVERETGYKLSSQLFDLVPYAISAAVSGSCVWLTGLFQISNDVVAIICKSLAGIITYLGVGFLIKLEAFNDNYEIIVSMMTKNNINKN